VERMMVLLAPYQIDHLVEVLATYRRTLSEELTKIFKSDEERELLKEHLVITDEIAGMFNVLEACNHE
jgi:hypothetical protein